MADVRAALYISLCKLFYSKPFLVAAGDGFFLCQARKWVNLLFEHMDKERTFHFTLA